MGIRPLRFRVSSPIAGEQIEPFVFEQVIDDDDRESVKLAIRAGLLARLLLCGYTNYFGDSNAFGFRSGIVECGSCGSIFALVRASPAAPAGWRAALNITGLSKKT